MKVLIVDKFEQQGIDQLKLAGCEVESAVGRKGTDLTEAVRQSNCRVMVVRSTKLPRETLAAAPGLALVLRAGAGYDNIDLAAANDLGIFVANCPGLNAVAVAELTMALVLSLDRRVPDAVRDLRAGRWNKTEYSKAAGLKGRTMGLVGLGQIGREVARRAAAFDMHVVGWSRSLARPGALLDGVELLPTPHDVCRRADVVSLHLASTPDTKGFANAAFFDAMRHGAFFINTSRGSVMDAAALARAIADKKVRAGLDVFAAEPAQAVADDFRDPLFGVDGVVYGTPHIGASTEQAQLAIADETVRLIKLFRETGRVENCVNVNPRSAAGRMLIVRHHNQPGVLAHVLSHLSQAHINVEEMENVILADRKTAVARIGMDAGPDAAVVERIRAGCEHILAATVV